MWIALLTLILIISIFLYGLKNGVYYIKYTFFCVSATIGATLCLFIFAFRPRSVENFKIANATARFVGKCLGLKVKISGKENLVSPESYILLMNHQSCLDQIVLSHVWPDRCTILAKKEILWGGPYGIGCWLCGCIFINRQNSIEARKTIDDALDTVKLNKLKFIVFPEGTRHDGNSLLPFKKGAFHMAINGKLPIVPVVVSSYNNFLCHRTKVFNEGIINVTCLPPINTDSLNASDVDSLAISTYQLMQQQFTKPTHYLTQGNNVNQNKSE